MLGKKTILAILAVVLAYQYSKTRKIIGETVITKSGRVEGIVSVSRDGREFYEWLGIPYAEPPVGDLRFESPRPVSSWKGIKEAHAYGSKCIQLDLISYEAAGDEDCLFLNVAVPKEKFHEAKQKKKLLPVMFWIHGGYFAFGSANIYRPTYFMDEDVILVTINYRLGAFGFLSTGDSNIRGNMGLKDQSVALRWVKQNIEAFGGDPDQITVFGESAGGASTHYQMISPMSKGLMSRAISQSGTVFMPWASYDKPLEQAKYFAKEVGCPTENSKVISECLRGKDLKSLVEAHRPETNPERPKRVMFVPVIEGVKDEDAFLTEDPRIMYKKGKVSPVPWMTGVNADEGVIFVVQFYRNETFRQRVGTNWNIVEDAVLSLSVDEMRHSQAIRDFYIGHNNDYDPLSEPEASALMKLSSDRSFLVSIEESVELHADVAPVYPYWYAQKGPGFADLLLKFKGKYHPGVEFLMATVKEFFLHTVLKQPRLYLGVGHADDIPMLFFAPMLFNIAKDSEHYSFSKELVTSWVSFARGDTPQFKNTKFPTITQEKLKTSKVQYIRLHDKPEVIKYPNPERLQFWNSLKGKNA